MTSVLQFILKLKLSFKEKLNFYKWLMPKIKKDSCRQNENSLYTYFRLWLLLDPAEQVPAGWYFWNGGEHNVYLPIVNLFFRNPSPEPMLRTYSPIGRDETYLVMSPTAKKCLNDMFDKSKEYFTPGLTELSKSIRLSGTFIRNLAKSRGTLFSYMTDLGITYTVTLWETIDSADELDELYNETVLDCTNTFTAYQIFNFSSTYFEYLEWLSNQDLSEVYLIGVPIPEEMCLGWSRYEPHHRATTNR